MLPGDVGAKRLREKRVLFSYGAEEIGTRAAINRYHYSEWFRCEENKRLREERDRADVALREELDFFHSKYTEC